jgi:hypothetical protein
VGDPETSGLSVNDGDDSRGELMGGIDQGLGKVDDDGYGAEG